MNIEDQARREAEAKYPMPMFDTAQHLYTTDVGLAHAVVLARQEGYAARIIDERSKPQPTVEDVMEVIMQWLSERSSLTGELRDRLTTMLNTSAAMADLERCQQRAKDVDMDELERITDQGRDG